MGSPIYLDKGRAAHRAALADDSILEQFGLLDWERELARVDPGFRDSSPVSRLDAFFVDDGAGIQFTEYNAETPAGAAYNDALSRVMMAMPVMHAFSRTHAAIPLPAAPSVMHSLLDAYHAYRGIREREA